MPYRRLIARPRALAGALSLAVALLVGARTHAPPGELILVERFDGPDRLLTNEHAWWNPHDPEAVTDPRWVVTSGSLFRRSDRGWSGVPDTGTPGPTSGDATGSATLRFQTRRGDLAEVSARLTFRINAYAEDGAGGEDGWDGLHLLLRRSAEDRLYAVSLARRDGRVDVKRKLPGGPSNGGTYTTLVDLEHPPLALGVDHRAQVTLCELADGRIAISVAVDDVHLATAVDDVATSGRMAPGAVGIRADDIDVELDDVTLTAVP